MKKLLLSTALSFMAITFVGGSANALDWPSWANPANLTKEKKASHSESFRPYLENTRHLQIPQWESEEWYVEDWTSQKDPIELIKGFYKADIIHDQTSSESAMPILVVGSNFYRLSGLDKRKVMQTVDTIYGITASKADGSFLIEDWYTNRLIGTFDRNGLRLN